MDRVIQFYHFFGFPIILKRDNSVSLSKLRIIWCLITLVWFTYHHLHTWDVHFIRRIYSIFLVSNPSLGNFSYSVTGIFLIFIEAVNPITLKVFLLASYFRNDSPTSFYYVLRQLDDAQQRVKPSKSSRRILTTFVSLLLGCLFVLTSVMIYLMYSFMHQCAYFENTCNMLYISPVWLDSWGELCNIFTINMGNTFMPIFVSVASLQFASCIRSAGKQMSQNNDAVIDQELIYRLLGIFHAQIVFN